MYSKAVEEFLRSKNIEVGDYVEVHSSEDGYSDHDKFIGVLMPRPDVGDDNILVIKLDNGYNIGIRFEKNVGIKKVRGKKQKPSFPKVQVQHQPSLPKIAIISTGGTIINKVDYETGGVYPLTKPEELLYDVPELAKIANVHVETLMSIASEDLTPKEWVRIAKSAADALNSGARGVVIMHGTDTMHYTSAALSFMLRDLSGPVVLTGAQRSSDRGSSDAFMNLVCAAHIAAKSDIGEVGVCMHADSSDNYCSFIRGTKVRKMHTSRRDAFRAINEEPIAHVDKSGTINYLGSYRKLEKNKKTKLVSGFEPKVALIKTYPGSDPEIIDFYVKKNYKGIIIEGTGLGHAPAYWLESIKSAIDSGIVLGITSQTIYGRVNQKVYSPLRRLAQAGAIFCEDMHPETAYAKLGFLLGNYKKEEAKKLLPENLVGEITKRSDVDTKYFK